MAGLWKWLWDVQSREEQKFRGECTNDKVQIHMQGSPSVTDRVPPKGVHRERCPLLSFIMDKTKGLELKPEEFKLDNKNLLVVSEAC